MKQIDLLPEYDIYVREYNIQLLECKCFLFDAHEILIQQGIKNEYLYFIVEGTARVEIYNSDGKVLSLSYSVSEGVLGEIELLNEQLDSSASVIAQTPLICLAYPYWLARIACHNNSEFLLKIAKDLTAKLTRSTDSFLWASFDSAEKRICSCILKEMIDDVYRGTLTNLSHITGISYRHTQRVIAHLCQKGILQKQNDGYHVVDYQQLISIIRK